MENGNWIDWEKEPDAASANRAYRLLNQIPQKSIADLTELAERGSVLSMIYLSYAYRQGRPGGDLPMMREKWLRAADLAGSAWGTYLFGYFLFTQRRLTEARAAFEKAANQDFPAAKRMLGTALIGGWGGPKSQLEGIKLIKEAYNEGDAGSKFLLGRYFMKTLNPFKFIRGVTLYLSAIINFYRILRIEGPNSQKLL